MERLRTKFLNVALNAVLHPASSNARRVASEQKAIVASASPLRIDELTAQRWFEVGFAATNWDEKVRCYTEAIRLRPNFFEAFDYRGSARQYKGDLEGAIQDFSEAIRLKPDCSHFFVGRGLARRDKGDLEGAIQDYDEAIRLDPNNANALTHRSVARRERGDAEGALEDLQNQVRLRPELYPFIHNFKTKGL